MVNGAPSHFSKTAGVQTDVTCPAGDGAASWPAMAASWGRTTQLETVGRTQLASARPKLNSCVPVEPQSPVAAPRFLLAVPVTALALRSSPVTGLCFLSPAQLAGPCCFFVSGNYSARVP